MGTLLTITIIAAVISTALIYFTKDASIKVSLFPGVLIGSAYSLSEVEYEDEETNESKFAYIATLQFSIICLMVTIVWEK